MHDRNGLSDWSCFRTFLIRFNIRLSPVKKNYGDRRTTKQRVDSVSEVLSVKAEDIEETPTFGTNLDTDYILGMAKVEGNVKILLDIAHKLLLHLRKWF